MYHIMSSASKEFYFFFFNLDTLCFFFLLIAMAGTSSTMMNKSSESKNPWLGHDLKRSTCSFCPLSRMLAVGLSDMALIMFSYVPSILTLLRAFIINACWILPNVFFCFYWYGHVVLSCILFMWWITFIDLQMLYQPCIPRINLLDRGIWSF